MRGAGRRGNPGRGLLLLVLLVGACSPPPAAPPAKPAAAEPAAAAPAAPSPAPAPTAPPALMHVTYGTQRPASDSGIYIADARGYFREAGVEVELVDFGGANEMIPALATGQADAGGTTPIAAVVNAILRGVEIKTVAERGSILPGFGYSAAVARKELIDSGRLRDFPDLKGLRVAIGAPAKGAGPSVQLLTTLERGGLQWEDVDVTTLSFPDMDGALHNGSVDVIYAAEPWVLRAVSGGYGVRWKGMDEVYPGQMLAGLAYSPVFTAQRPEVARAFMVAYVRGVRRYLDALNKDQDKAELYSIIAEYSSLKDRAVLEQMVWHGVKPDPFVNREAVARDVNAYVQWGTVPEPVDVDRLLDDQWVRYAVERLGPYR